MQDKFSGTVSADLVSSAATSAPAGRPRVPAVIAVAGRPDFLMGAYSPEDIGYQVQEYFVSGTARSFIAADDAIPIDGRWNATPAAEADFATRVVALTPAQPRQFNGTVIVEWLNVTGGTDSAAVWLMAHREMIRSGCAYIGVSAQSVGIEGGSSIMGMDNSLKKLNPARYATLDHPGDAFSYDIFSQIGDLVRGGEGSGLIGELVPQAVIAVGESQSAIFLTTYVNAIDPQARAFDGFLIHSRMGSVARLDGDMDLSAPDSRVAGVRIRPDLRVPVLAFITEGDLVGFPAVLGYSAARQPDGDRLRVWELAGAAHADNYTIQGSFIDSGKAPLEQLAATFAPTTSILGMPVEAPINFGPQHHYVVQAALKCLERWVRFQEAPPASPRIETGGEAGALVLDQHGMAVGGIRTPWTDVPTARLSSDGNVGNLMAAIFGTSSLFDAATLDRLYPEGKTEYLGLFEASLDAAIDQGFILEDDRAEIVGLAALMYPSSSVPE